MKYLVCTMSSHGFVYPAIGIAKELQRRGHEIVFVTGPSFDYPIRQQGLERIPNGANDLDCFSLHKWTQPREVSRQIRYLNAAIEKFQPDTLIGTVLCQGVPIASEIHDLPLSIIGFVTYLWAFPDVLQRPESSWSECDRIMVNMLKSDIEEYKLLRKIFKLSKTSVPSRKMPMLGDLFLLQNLPELVKNPETFPQEVHFVGSCLWGESTRDIELEKWLHDAKCSGNPILYVQPGAFFDGVNFWPFLVDALAEKPIRVVAAVGRMIGQEEDFSPDSYPPNFYVREYVPQEQVLPHASGVVTKGNTTAILGAFTHGIPLLLIPGGGEQKLIAKLCLEVAVCVGIHEADVSVKTVNDKIQELIMRTDIKQNARRVRSLFKKSNGHQKAADLIERLAVIRGPILRSQVHQL